jgi:5-methylcytosine-specific restriction protein A
VPTKPLKVCLEPGCPELTAQRRCAEHTRTQNKTWRSKHSSFYNTPRWKRTRLAYLRAHPWCECPDDCGELATEVDHIVRIEDGGEKFAWSNLQALTRSAHSRKTAYEVWHNR